MTALPLRAAARPSASPSARAELGWRILAVVSVAVAVAVTAIVAAGAGHPSFQYDEIDQLQMSRMLLGLDVPEVRGGGYYPGWALLLAPIWLLTDDPFTVYVVAIVLGAALGLAAIWPLSRIAARMRLSVPQSVVAAAIVVTLPAVAIQADYVLSERVLLLCVAGAVLAAWRLWERPSIVRALVFVAVLGAMHSTHVRVAPVLLASMIWLLFLALHHWRAAIVGLVALVAVYWAVGTVSTDLNIQLLGDFTQGGTLEENLEDLRGGLLARSTVGQAWGQLVGTLGLAAVGAVGLAVAAWRELRRLRVGRASYVLAIATAMFLLTALQWANEWHLYFNPWRRLDVWVYGRYVDPVISLLVLAGVALLIRGIRRRILVVAAVLAAPVLAAATFWLALDAPTWGHVTPAHIPGVSAWQFLFPAEAFPEDARTPSTLTNENRLWAVASLGVAAAFAAFLLLRRFRIALAALLVAAAAAMSLSADVASDRFREWEGQVPAAVHDMRDAIDTVGGDVEFDILTGCRENGAFTSVVLNEAGYWFLPTVATSVPRGETASGDLILTCGDEAPEGVGDAALVLGGEFRDSTFWVRPGELRDELAARGLVAP